MIPQTLICLTLCASPFPAADPTALRAVAVDLGALDQATFERLDFTNLYKSLLVRITQEQLAVVDVDEETDLTLGFAVDGADSLEIEVRRDDERHDTHVPLAGRSLEELHLAVMHESIELLRKVQASPPLVVVSPAGPLPESPRWNVQPSAGLLALWTPDQAALLIDVGSHLISPSGLGVIAGVALSLPLGLDDRFAVVEWGARGGISFRRQVSENLAWSATASAGLWHHHFRFTDDQGTFEGDRFEPVAIFQTAAHWQLADAVEVSLSGGLLVTPHERIHFTLDGRLWHTTPVRGLLGLVLSHSLSL